MVKINRGRDMMKTKGGSKKEEAGMKHRDIKGSNREEERETKRTTE